MSIARQASASNTAAAASSVIVTVTTVANDTVFVVVFLRDPTNESVVTSVTDSGGSVYSVRQTRGQTKAGAFGRIETWSTPVNGAKASTTVTVNVSLSTADLIGVAIDYSGIASLGQLATNSSASTSTPAIGINIQDNNNWVLCAIACIGSATYTNINGNIRANVNTTTILGIVGDWTNVTQPTSTGINGTLSVAESVGGGAIELRTRLDTMFDMTPGSCVTWREN